MMPFGLTYTPKMYMTLMDEVLHPYLGNFVIIFLDDIVIHSASKEENIHHLCLIFELLKAHQLYAKKRKREFFEK